MVDGVWKVLSLQAKRFRSAGVKLHAGFGRADFHDPAAPGIERTRSQHERFAVAIDDEIMVTDRPWLDLVQGNVRRSRHKEDR